MVAKGADGRALGDGLKSYYRAKIEELEILCRDKQHNMRRLEAQRNELNTKGGDLSTVPPPPFHPPLLPRPRFLPALHSGSRSETGKKNSNNVMHIRREIAIQ